MDFIGILLFYCLKTMDNNRRTIKTIDILKIPYRGKPLRKLRSWQSFKYISEVVHVLQLFQVFVTCIHVFLYKLSVFQSEAWICLRFSWIQPQNMLEICLSKNVQESIWPTPRMREFVKGMKMKKFWNAYALDCQNIGHQLGQ